MAASSCLSRPAPSMSSGHSRPMAFSTSGRFSRISPIGPRLRTSILATVALLSCRLAKAWPSELDPPLRSTARPRVPGQPATHHGGGRERCMPDHYFRVIAGTLVVKGYEPDGDSLRFIADNPGLYNGLRNERKARPGKDVSLQLRF